MSRMPAVYPTALHMLAAAANTAPDNIALRCGSEEMTYRAYASCVAGFADELGRDVCGERVALVMANSIDIAVATFAVGAAGAQVVPLNPAYTDHELRPILEDAAPIAIVCDESLSERVARIAEELGIRRVIRVGAGKRLTSWQTQLVLLPSPPESDTLSTLQYTGGTTGRSKGVNLSHKAVAINVAQREALLPSGDGERILIVTPLYHSYAIAMGLYLAVYCRGTLNILPRYRPDDVLATIARERITLFAGSPTLFVGLMANERFLENGLLIAEAVLLRRIGASGRDTAPLGAGNWLRHLRGIRTERSGAGADLQSAQRRSQARLGRSATAVDRDRDRRCYRRNVTAAGWRSG